MSTTDISSPTQALELAARVIRGIRTELRRKGWTDDVNNADIPETVSWNQMYPIPQVIIRFLGERDSWAVDVEKAARKVLPRHGQTIVHSSFHEVGDTFLKTLKTDYVKVVIENEP